MGLCAAWTRSNKNIQSEPVLSDQHVRCADVDDAAVRAGMYQRVSAECELLGTFVRPGCGLCLLVHLSKRGGLKEAMANTRQMDWGT